MELKRIGVWSLTRISTLFGLILGIIMAIIYAIMYKIASAAIPQEVMLQTPSLQTLGMFSWGMVAIVIIQYVVAGFIIGILGALIYNLIARYCGGGIQLEFSDKKK